MDNFTELNLHSNICKAIALCGYTKPTPVQSKAIPEVMAGRDVVVSAQTGTGKTAAFVLPALHNLSLQEQPSKKPRVLILTPTRELATQIIKAASMYGKLMRFNFATLVGGMPYREQERDLARGVDIIVATPGRLMDHMEQKRVDLSDVEMLILDEADRMLDMGFIDDVQYIAKLTPSKRQTLLFSATLDNKLMNAVKHLLKNPIRIDLSHEKLAAPQIKQEMYKANNAHHKTRLLKHFLRDVNVYKAIIFSATKVNADRLTDQLCDEGFAAAALHGDLRQNVRNRTLEQLRRGKIQYLVATDVAARGIDVSDITHVFNYDLPRFCEDYVHRIGRTGRAGKTGIAISFVLPTDTRHVQSIERYTGQRIKLIQNVDLGDTTSSNKSPDSQEILSLRKDSDGYGDRPQRSHGSDRPERSFKSDRGDRPERGGFRSDRGDRPERSGSGFKSDRGDRPERSSFRSDRGDRPERSGGGFKSDRGDRPERSSFRSDRSDRPERSGSGFKSDRGDRPERSSFRSDRGDRPERSGSGFKSDRGDRPERGGFKSDRGDRPERSSSFRSDRGDRPERSGGGGFKSDRGDRPERSSFRPDRGDRPERPAFKEGYRAKSKLSSDQKEPWTGGERRSRKPTDGDTYRAKSSGDSDKRRSSFGDSKQRGDKSPRKDAGRSFKKRSASSSKEPKFSDDSGASTR